MNIGRIFANAIARRIAYVIVAAALAWMGLSDAKAQSAPAACNVGSGCTKQVAYERCMAMAAYAMAHPVMAGQHSPTCTDLGVPSRRWLCRIGRPDGMSAQACSLMSSPSVSWGYEWHYVDCPPNAPWDDALKVCLTPCPTGQERHAISKQCIATCGSRAPVVVSGGGGVIPNGSVGCVGGSSGCEVMYSANGDGTYTQTFIGGSSSHCSVVPNECSQNGPGYILNAGLGVCQPPVTECAENEVKDPVTGMCQQGCPAGMVLDAQGICKPKTEDCPPGNVRSPSGQCLPGDGQCAAGEARRENGTCGRDSNGDGVADEDDGDPENDPEEFFAGGDSCAAPPSCSGGPIECGMARIQWRIDCNTRRTVNVTGGACSAMPVCVGENCKAMEYAQLLQQWRAACALEKMADAEAGEGSDNQDLIDLLTEPGSIQPDLGGTGDMPGGGGYQWGEDEEFEPDTGGFGWSSSCPANPTVSVFGSTLTFDLSPLCQWVGLGGYLVLILAGLASLRIVSGGNA